MRLLLCSDFAGIGFKYTNKFGVDLRNKSCLFVGYAQENDEGEMSSSAQKLREMGLNIDFLTKDYDFCGKIDVIFVRGGNTTRLIHYLRLLL